MASRHGIGFHLSRLGAECFLNPISARDASANHPFRLPTQIASKRQEASDPRLPSSHRPLFRGVLSLKSKEAALKVEITIKELEHMYEMIR